MRVRLEPPGRGRGRRRSTLLGVAVVLGLAAVPAFALSGTTTRVNVDSAGNQAEDGTSGTPAMDADGLFVLFFSDAPALVPDDDDAEPDIFVRDLATGVTTLVSRSSSGRKGNAGSGPLSALSADGQHAAFVSEATNLVRGDRNGEPDVFAHDRRTGATTRVSVSSTGDEAGGVSTSPSISGDGRVVAFQSFAHDLVAGDTNRLSDVFVHDRVAATTTRVSVDGAGAQANGGSGLPAVSGDGRHVAFLSFASNLVADDTNGERDVFVHDRLTGTNTRVNVDSAGNQAVGNPRASFTRVAISRDGRFVAFGSQAANLVDGDTNGSLDIFVHDRQTGATSRVSIDSAGTQANGRSFEPAISDDGRFVVFVSRASNLVADDTNARTDVFVHDRRTGATTRGSLGSTGTQGEDDSGGPAIAGNGSRVAFESWATTFVANDTNDRRDVFVRELSPPSP